MGIMDSIKSAFGGGDDDAAPDATLVEPAVEEPMVEPTAEPVVEPMVEPMAEPEVTPEPEAEPTPEEPAMDEPVGGTEANMDAKTCDNCGADFGSCEHTAEAATV
jgi:hypothetical protein